jgi:prepilin-type N-terminal cleavage/methylation domain-containing protein
MNKSEANKGFTLIELLVVIAIIAILVAFVVSNFLGARQRAKDVKKKSELQQIKSALRLYYNDYNIYPLPSSTQTNRLDACGVAVSPAGPSTTCSSSVCSGRFAAGGVEGCDTVYMKQLPPSTDYVWSYKQQSSGEDFCLWTSLDNVSDGEIAKSQARCSSVCSSLVSSSDYVVCAD